jgi:nucleotidyltransferase/DNA polymerase involved in DNA repair
VAPGARRRRPQGFADRGAKTISNETTLESDIRDFPTLEKILWRLCERVSARLKSGNLPARPSR